MDLVVRILGVLCGLIVVLGIFVWKLWLEHKREMALIQRGRYKMKRRQRRKP